MFYKLYKSIKTELAGLDFLTAVTWFNNQYEQGSVVDTSLMVEFNPDAIKQLMSKDTTSVDMPIRLHFANKLLAGPDGTLRDTAIEAFNNQLADVIATLDGANLLDTDLTALTLRPLQLAGVSPFQKTNGWQIWLIDFTAKVDKLALKNSIDQITITTTVAGNGTITSQPADLTTVKKGQLVILSANPANGSTFTQWNVDGVVQTANLIYFKAVKAVTAVAEFASNLLTERLKAFTAPAIQKGNRTFFGDYSANDNDLQVKKQRVATLSGGQYITHPMTGWNWSGTWEFEIAFKPSAIPVGAMSLMSNRISGVGIDVLINATTIYITINGTAYMATGITLTEVNVIKIKKTGSLTYELYINNALSKSATVALALATTNLMVVGVRRVISAYDLYFSGIIFYYSIGPLITKANHGQGATLYNTQSDANHGTVVGAVLATFWGSTCDECEAYEHAIGATLYRNNTDQTILPICGNNTYTIAGFTRVGYFAPGSGALKGLPNTYTIPVNPALNAIIPAGDYTADQLGALTASANLVIEQDPERIFGFTVKTL